jgi:hypothetical protein
MVGPRPTQPACNTPNDQAVVGGRDPAMPYSNRMRLSANSVSAVSLGGPCNAIEFNVPILKGVEKAIFSFAEQEFVNSSRIFSFFLKWPCRSSRASVPIQTSVTPNAGSPSIALPLSWPSPRRRLRPARCYTAVELRRAVCRIALSSELTTARLSENLTASASERGVDTRSICVDDRLTAPLVGRGRIRGAPVKSTPRRGVDHGRLQNPSPLPPAQAHGHCSQARRCCRQSIFRPLANAAPRLCVER